MAYAMFSASCFALPPLTMWVIEQALLHFVSMVPLSLGIHPGFLADMADVSLPNYRHFHRTVGMMSYVHVGLHVAATLRNNLSYTVLVAQSILLLLVSRQVYQRYSI